MISVDDLGDINIGAGSLTPVLPAGEYEMKLVDIKRIQMKISEKYLKDDGITHKPAFGFIMMPTDDSVPVTEIWIKRPISFGKLAGLPKLLKQLDRAYSQKLQDTFAFNPQKLAQYLNSLVGRTYSVEMEPSEDGKWNNIISIRPLTTQSTATNGATATRSGSADKVPTGSGAQNGSKRASPKSGFEEYPDADELPFE